MYLQQQQANLGHEAVVNRPTANIDYRHINT